MLQNSFIFDYEERMKFLPKTFVFEKNVQDLRIDSAVFNGMKKWIGRVMEIFEAFQVNCRL